MGSSPFWRGLGMWLIACNYLRTTGYIMCSIFHYWSLLLVTKGRARVPYLWNLLAAELSRNHWWFATLVLNSEEEKCNIRFLCNGKEVVPRMLHESGHMSSIITLWSSWILKESRMLGKDKLSVKQGRAPLRLRKPGCFVRAEINDCPFGTTDLLWARYLIIRMFIIMLLLLLGWKFCKDCL